MPISCKQPIESHTFVNIVSKSYQPTFEDFSKHEDLIYLLASKLLTERVDL